DLVLEPVDAAAMGRRCDVVFTATPHGVAMELAGAILDAGAVLIDIGSDFRFRDPAVYETWYKVPHTRPELAAEAVYGLAELFGQEVKEARLRSEEHTSELQSRENLVCRLLLEKKKQREQQDQL